MVDEIKNKQSFNSQEIEIDILPVLFLCLTKIKKKSSSAPPKKGSSGKLNTQTMFYKNTF